MLSPNNTSWRCSARQYRAVRREVGYILFMLSCGGHIHACTDAPRHSHHGLHTSSFLNAKLNHRNTLKLFNPHPLKNSITCITVSPIPNALNLRNYTARIVSLNPGDCVKPYYDALPCAQTKRLQYTEEAPLYWPRICIKLDEIWCGRIVR